MNRRAMVILPGIALAAGRGFSQTKPAAGSPSTGTGRISHKAKAKFSRLKAFSAIPKSEAKQTKFVGFLTTLLSLTPNQRTEAANLFSAAGASGAQVKQNLKTARTTLSEAVKNNDAAAIGNAAALIGSLTGQHHEIGAKAHAAFVQMLTPDQRSKFDQFRS